MIRCRFRATRVAPATTLAVACLIASTGCWARDDGAGREDRADQIRRPVRVAFSPHLSWGPIMIAQEEGFFTAEGLDVELVSALRPEESLVALISGDIDVQPGPLHTGFFSAITRGAPIRIIAGMAQLRQGDCSYFAIVLRKGLDTAGTPQLTRMRASQDGASRYVVSRMLARRNIRIADIETVRLPEAVMAMSLENGSLDAVAVSEPALSRVSRSGRMWLTGESAVPDFQWSVLAFSQRLLSRERDTGVRFLRAYQRGVAQYNTGKSDRNVAIMTKLTGASERDVRSACWPAFASDSRINWASILEFQTWARQERLMEQTLPQEKVWDSAFVAAAAPVPALHTTR